MRSVRYCPYVESVESRLMCDGDLVLAMGCAPAPQEVMDAPPKAQAPQPGKSPIGTPDVPDPADTLINPYQFPPINSTDPSVDYFAYYTDYAGDDRSVAIG